MLQRPGLRTERWAYGLLLAGIFGLFAAELARDYQPAKLGAVFCLLLWFPLIALHELGHAAAARLCNWSVERVVIGFGRPLWRFEVRGVEVEIRRLPVEGFVAIRPRDLRAPRIKQAFIYFAGPGTELLVLAVVALIVGPGTLLTRTDDPAIIAAQSLGICVMLGAVFNLIPRGGGLDPRTGQPSARVNDGLGIIKSFTWPMERYAAMISRWR